MAWEGTGKKGSNPLIAICMPHRGHVSMEFVEKTWIPYRSRTEKAFDTIAFMSKVPSISVARNMLVDMALKAGADYIFWIDSDIIFEDMDPLKALNTLFECNVPIASALYRAKQTTGFNWAAWIKIQKNVKGFGYAPIANWSEGANWFEVDSIGMGCCLMKREVFEKIPRPWFVWNDDGENSEDFYFCQKAQDVGYKINVYTDIHLTHLGELAVKWDGTFRTELV